MFNALHHCVLDSECSAASMLLILQLRCAMNPAGVHVLESILHAEMCQLVHLWRHGCAIRTPVLGECHCFRSVTKKVDAAGLQIAE